MGVSLLAVRLTVREERRYGTWFGNDLAYGTMAKASVPIPSFQARSRVEHFTAITVLCRSV